MKIIEKNKKKKNFIICVERKVENFRFNHLGIVPKAKKQYLISNKQNPVGE